MKQSWAHKNLLTRKFVAAVVLCLFVMKGLSFLGMTASLAADPLAHNQFAASVVLGTHCEKNNDNADHSDRHIDHSQCCVFCSSASRNVAIAIDVIFSQVVTVLLPEKQLSVLATTYDDSFIMSSKPIAWGSSWSSTAPPRAWGISWPKTVSVLGATRVIATKSIIINTQIHKLISVWTLM